MLRWGRMEIVKMMEQVKKLSCLEIKDIGRPISKCAENKKILFFNNSSDLYSKIDGLRELISLSSKAGGKFCFVFILVTSQLINHKFRDNPKI